MRWIRRYRERRALLGVARLLVALDGAGPERRLLERSVVRVGSGARG